MMRTIFITLACLGAGIAPGIAEDLAEMERGRMLTSSEMDRITAGNFSAAELTRKANGIQAIARHQNSNNSSASATANSFLTPGSGGVPVLDFSGSAQTIDDVVVVPVVPPADPEPVYSNRASELLRR